MSRKTENSVRWRTETGLNAMPAYKFLDKTAVGGHGFPSTTRYFDGRLAMLITFAGSIFILGMTFKISLLGSGSVLLAGLILGRSVAKAIGEIF